MTVSDDGQDRNKRQEIPGGAARERGTHVAPSAPIVGSGHHETTQTTPKPVLTAIEDVIGDHISGADFAMGVHKIAAEQVVAALEAAGARIVMEPKDAG